MIKPPIRQTDRWGSGWYGASRGDRKHRGVDVACYPGSTVFTLLPGTVTKIGLPYPPGDPDKEHLRYVQVTGADGRSLRYFYVEPSVKVGDHLLRREKIGVTQRLGGAYPGITEHYHLEIKLADGTYVDPTDLVLA